ncbi:hypothetical protein N9571_05455 [Yoonia sp.]|nr:hypothetical protein [Yoonia sp.]
MSKYHPIDVRYKGPSTAYRGSAKQQKSTFTAVAKASTTAKSSPSPWDGAKTTVPEPATPAPAPSGTKASASKEATRSPITLKNIYLVLAGIIFLSLFLR